MLSHRSKSALAGQLGISRSSLYYRARQPPKDWELKTRIEAVLHTEPSYGHRRLSAVLKINKKRVRRVMRLFGIKPYRRRKWPRKKKKPPSGGMSYPNLLLALSPERPHQIWVSDFTELPFHGKIIFLSTIMDIFTRLIVGFHVLTNHSVQLIIPALLMALMKYPPPEILHSDQGSEYRSELYTTLVTAVGIRPSMSRPASPWENGYQESFNNQFKVDLGDPNRFDRYGELIAEIYATIHAYNTRRIHTSLKMPPVNFEQRYFLLNRSHSSSVG